MSYFTYFSKNLNSQNHGNRDPEAIRGTCEKMCPEDEMELRIKEKLIHILEMNGSERKLVKSYSRSAADSNMAIPGHLRPYHVLCDTVMYLLFDVTKRSDVSAPTIYDFINDRLKAVRQDMTIQRLLARQCAHLLDPMIRFYVYFGFRLYGFPLKDYDPVLNKKYLLECLKWFLSCCDQIDQSSTTDELDSIMTGLDISERMSCDRVLMESVYVLCNLDDVHPMFRYVTLSKDLKTHPTLKLSFEVAIANMKGNFIQVGRALDKLCPLLYCALCVHLPVMQRRALEVLTHGYHSKRLSVPSSVIRQWLCLASDWEARAVCQHYGLKVDGTVVIFDKTAFKTDVPVHQHQLEFYLPLVEISERFPETRLERHLPDPIVILNHGNIPYLCAIQITLTYLPKNTGQVQLELNKSIRFFISKKEYEKRSYIIDLKISIVKC